MGGGGLRSGAAGQARLFAGLTAAVIVNTLWLGFLSYQTRLKEHGFSDE